ncbi:MAG: cytochrome c3 family protein [Planctomycetes bacterium]|nr:cytochrome c3 family protein [Planctomycetota bacterium]
MALKKKYALLSGLIIVTAVLLLPAMIPNLGSLPPQPIAFNHRLHMERVQGIGCRDCHQLAHLQTYAGIPSKFVCFDCHNPDANESDANADAFKPEFGTLMAFAKTGEDIPWHRVTFTPEDVFFSHRRHVAVAKIDCRKCHPEIPDRTSPLDRGPIMMGMNTCIKCHEEAKASVDCVACHR